MLNDHYPSKPNAPFRFNINGVDVQLRQCSSAVDFRTSFAVNGRDEGSKHRAHASFVRVSAGLIVTARPT
jgi:hypothetical protein